MRPPRFRWYILSCLFIRQRSSTVHCKSLFFHRTRIPINLIASRPFALFIDMYARCHRFPWESYYFLSFTNTLINLKSILLQKFNWTLVSFFLYLFNILNIKSLQRFKLNFDWSTTWLELNYFDKFC